jgi:predicted PolB exonuclease-like 3'-5' exonuclease
MSSRYYKAGRLREIAEYCENDVVNTYRVWLRYELFCGRLSQAGFQASEAKVAEFLRGRESARAAFASVPASENAVTTPAG